MDSAALTQHIWEGRAWHVRSVCLAACNAGQQRKLDGGSIGENPYPVGGDPYKGGDNGHYHDAWDIGFNFVA